MSSELTGIGAPHALMLLRRAAIAFRDSSGRIGDTPIIVPHRCARFSAATKRGRPARVYHGWKFDTAGNCLEMPNLPPTRISGTR